MRYKKEIIDRIVMSLRTVDADIANEFLGKFNRHYAELFVFSSEVNFYFHELLTKKGFNYSVGVPEDEDAIPYWLEDIDSVVLPAIRQSRSQ